jgi:hypothetical protein
MLSVESFALANDQLFFLNNYNLYNHWSKTPVFNTSWWFWYYGKFNAADKILIALQTGVFYTGIGKSNQEIAALATVVIQRFWAQEHEVKKQNI